MIIVGLTGATGGKLKGICDYLISVPSNDTPYVQEMHILVGHILCELIENFISLE
jgi:D-sedoheptulose 7-phosphate isomerase